MVDNLVPGALGISGITCPIWLVPVFLLSLGALLVWWWRPVHDCRLLVMGLAFIVPSYWLVYSARAEWGYDGNMIYPNWGRYHLLPQIGWTLLIVGGLRRFRLKLSPDGNLSRRQLHGVVFLVAGLFVAQLPRALIATSYRDGSQRSVLRRIEETDARCQTQQISAETARAVLGRLPVPACNDTDNGWDLLRGSTAPRELAPAEARRILTGTD
jgi:hypothetical protein